MSKILKSYTIVPSDLYVQRDADRQVKNIIEEMGRPGYVLVSRQMGKTNLLLNAKRHLETSDDVFVYIDLSNSFESARSCFENIIDIGIETNPEKFNSVTATISKSRKELLDTPPHKQHTDELRLLLKAIPGKLVIILDEIDAITKTQYSDQFFAQIRSIYFSRINFKELEKLTYILSGVVEPNEIIKDPKISPFNIGQKIFLNDFNREEFELFLNNSKLKLNQSVRDKIFYWTSGNPRMTWDVCSEVEDRIQWQELTSKSIDEIVSEIYLTTFDKPPIDNIRNLVKIDQEIRKAIIEIEHQKGREVSDRVKSKLYLSGIINYEENEIRIKNEIIKQSLNSPWIKSLDESDKLGMEYGYLLAKQLGEKPNNLPYPSLGHLFKGRENVMRELHQNFKREKLAAIVGSAIHGLGGIGKTRLAVEYAYRYQSEYSSILFVVTDSPEKIFSNIAALGGTTILNLPEHILKEEQGRYEAVVKWLNDHPGWLLILDGADNITSIRRVEELIGSLRGGHILITSRQTNFSSRIKEMPLHMLAKADAIAFLLERTENRRRKTGEDEALARTIVDKLDCLVLALEQAGAYINKRRLTLLQYCQTWQQNYDQVLEWYDEQLMQYPSSVAITWQTSVNELSQLAVTLLNRLAWLAPDPIPETLLKTNAGKEDEIFGLSVLEELEQHSLIIRSGDQPEFTVHQLVQDIARRKQANGVTVNEVETSLVWLCNAFIGNPYDVDSWPVLEPLMPHAASLIKFLNEASKTNRALSWLMNKLAAVYDTKAQYKEAEQLMRRALAMDEQCFGENDSDVAIDLNNLAQLLQATNRQSEAEPLMRRALAIDEQSFGENHPNVAIDLNNLAQLLQATNRQSEAEPLMRRALAIDEQSFGENHPNVARDLNNLAQLLQATNRLSEAEPLMRRALAIDEQSFGKNHPNVAIRLNNLTQLLKALNQLGEAESLMRRALAIDEKSFGESHPKVAIRLNNLANLLQDTKRLSEAEPLMRRALAIDEQSFGENHPNVAIRLNNLAQLLQSTNRLGEAEPLMRRALIIDEQNFGENHPDVAIDLNNLAQLLKATNRLSQAEPLVRRALVIDEQSFGENHPNVAIDLNNLAQLLLSANRLSEAEPLIRRALAIDMQNFGENHINIAIDMNNLAKLLQSNNRLEEAERLMRQAFIIFFKRLGFDHLDTQTVSNNYTILLRENGNDDEEITAIIQDIKHT